jgi:hypothetical protein
MKKALFILAITSTIFAFNSCKKFDGPNDNGHSGKNLRADATVALDWYNLQLRFLLERNSTMNAVYFGYLGIGLWEAVRGENKNSVSLSTKLNQMPAMPQAENMGYDWVISANAVMASMLRSFNTGLTPANLASIDSLEKVYNDNSSTSQNSEKFARSQAFGRSVATAIHDWFLTDNFNPGNAGYVPPVFPGAWIPTPPLYLNAINPYVGSARFYVSENASIVVPPPPYLYSEIPGSDFYNMAKNVYDVNKALTPAQKDLANYFIDQGNGIGYTPGGHHFSVITQILSAKGVGLAQAAEVYAKAGIAERDITIVIFGAKFKYNQIRPVSYIRKVIDTAWMPFIPNTPPHPEYPAAHAGVTGAVMEAVARVLGNDFSFTDHTYDFRGFPSRPYTTIFGVAEESGISRLYGGIHYLESIHTGWAIAKEVGDNVGDITLTIDP